jgi:hypothetical protein
MASPPTFPPSSLSLSYQRGASLTASSVGGGSSTSAGRFSSHVASAIAASAAIIAEEEQADDEEAEAEADEDEAEEAELEEGDAHDRKYANEDADDDDDDGRDAGADDGAYIFSVLLVACVGYLCASDRRCCAENHWLLDQFMWISLHPGYGGADDYDDYEWLQPAQGSVHEMNAGQACTRPWEIC